jgi:hypothetical protein
MPTYAADTREASQTPAPCLRLVHQGLVFDNSGAEPRPVFETRGGRVVNLTDEIPGWAKSLLSGTGGVQE